LPQTLAAGRPRRAGRVLVLGIGNPGRRDDGLGPRLVERLRALRLPGVAVDANYQLQVEDALTVSRFARVVFVDAARAGARAFRLAAIAPRAEFAFTTHALSPRSVLALARELYEKSPSARLLAIRGYDFGLGDGLTAQAARNLEAALERLVAFIGERPDSAAPSRRHPRPPRRKSL
jgi:hydrogenase maturation protease